MREFLFRGKDVETGDWIDGYYVCLNSKEHRIYSGYAETDCGDYYPDFWTVDPETVGQFTGLTSHGKKIFEGDICQNTRTGEIVSVKWHGTMAGFVWSKRQEKSHLFDFGELFRAYDKYVVIGNIHDNPELLKEE